MTKQREIKYKYQEILENPFIQEMIELGTIRLLGVFWKERFVIRNDVQNEEIVINYR